jgi:hypothetical protein
VWIKETDNEQAGSGLVGSFVVGCRGPSRARTSDGRCLEDQYTLSRVGSPHDISVWLYGYYNGTRHNTVLETQDFREHANKVMDFCLGNPKSTVMDAVEKVLGAKR